MFIVYWMYNITVADSTVNFCKLPIPVLPVLALRRESSSRNPGISEVVY